MSQGTDTCGSTYTTLGQRVFSCTAAKGHRGAHYYERDLVAEDKVHNKQRRNGLIVVPGDRR